MIADRKFRNEATGYIWVFVGRTCQMVWYVLLHCGQLFFFFFFVFDASYIFLYKYVLIYLPTRSYMSNISPFSEEFSEQSKSIRVGIWDRFNRGPQLTPGL